MLMLWVESHLLLPWTLYKKKKKDTLDKKGAKIFEDNPTFKRWGQLTLIRFCGVYADLRQIKPVDDLCS